ncbi:hypothetical protein ACOMHN_009114 [Nucella lapillus]
MGAHMNTCYYCEKGEVKISREPVWSPEEASLKLYLKGRAVNMYAPTTVTDYNIAKPGDLPAEKLQLEWVYGYRGRDCRSNLYYLPTGELVYFTAAVVVLFNTEEQTQRHYLGHNDDVKCLAVHPDMIRIATGQVAGHDRREGRRKRAGSANEKAEEMSESLPHIRIWDSVSLHTLHVLGLGDFDRAVCCISFSTMDSGLHLVAVDEANEHAISVWDLSRDKPHKITETKSSTEPVLAVEFHPSEKGAIVSCGKGQITFWTYEGGALAKKQGVYEKYDKPKYVLCLAFAPNGDVLSGDSNGNIIVWGKGTNRISQAVLGAHEGGVFSLCSTKDGNLLSGGGKDRKVVEWDSGYSKTARETEVGEAYGPVRTLSQGKGGLVLIGTTKNCILQGSLDLEFTPVMQGHTDELWGLSTHPSQHQFLTCGSDRNVYLWDSQSRTVVWTKELNDGAHCCCFHPDGHLVAIGTMTARWLVLDLATHEVISVHTDGNEQIEAIAYSPDGNYIALGSRDNYTYVYQVSDGGRKYSRVGRCSGHSSFITHIDWSQDSQFLASNSGDYELLYWSATSCKQVTSPSAVRDLQWASQSCTLGFNAAGRTSSFLIQAGPAPSLYRQDQLLPYTSRTSSFYIQAGPAPSLYRQDQLLPYTGRTSSFLIQAGPAPSLYRQDQLLPSFYRQDQLLPSFYRQDQLLIQAGPAPSLYRQDQLHPYTGRTNSFLIQAGPAPSLYRQDQLLPTGSFLIQAGPAPSLYRQDQLLPYTGRTSSFLIQAGPAPSLYRQDQLLPYTGRTSSFLPAPSIYRQDQLLPYTGRTSSFLPYTGRTSSFLIQAGRAPSFYRQDQLLPYTGRTSSFLIQAGPPPSLYRQDQLLPTGSFLIQAGPAPSLYRQDQLLPSTGRTSSFLIQAGPAPSFYRQDQLFPYTDRTSSFLIQAGPAPSFLLQAGPAPSFLQQAGPAPSFLQQAGQAPSFLQQAGPAPSFLLQAGQAPSFLLQAGPAPSFLIQAGPAPSFLIQAGPAPSLYRQDQLLPYTGRTSSFLLQAGPAPSFLKQAGQAPSFLKQAMSWFVQCWSTQLTTLLMEHTADNTPYGAHS